jgi:hypothetical protein
MREGWSLSLCESFTRVLSLDGIVLGKFRVIWFVFYTNRVVIVFSPSTDQWCKQLRADSPIVSITAEFSCKPERKQHGMQTCAAFPILDYDFAFTSHTR